MANNAIPRRVRVASSTGRVQDIDVFDADTGEKVQGVIRVVIERGGATLELSAEWPVTAKSHLVVDPEYRGATLQGVKTTTVSYPLGKFEIETL